MAEVSTAKAKIKRAIHQIENVQILLGGLPKYAIENGKKKQAQSIILRLAAIQNEMEELFKAELA